MALTEAVQKRRFHSTITRGSPKYSHQSAGLVEGANGLAAGLLRTYRISLEGKLQVTLEPKHPIMPFLVNSVGWNMVEGGGGAVYGVPKAIRADTGGIARGDRAGGGPCSLRRARQPPVAESRQPPQNRQRFRAGQPQRKRRMYRCMCKSTLQARRMKPWQALSPVSVRAQERRAEPCRSVSLHCRARFQRGL